MASVTAVELCYCGKAAIDNSTTNGCGSVPRKLYLGKEAAFGLQAVVCGSLIYNSPFLFVGKGTVSESLGDLHRVL